MSVCFSFFLSQKNLPHTLTHIMSALSLPSGMQEKLKRIFGNATDVVLTPLEERKKPFLNSVIRSLYPRLSAHDRANFAKFAQPFIGSGFAKVDVDMPAQEQRNALQHIVYSGPAKEGLEELLLAYRMDNPANPSDSREVSGKLTLRSRFYLPGDESLLESPSQQVSDTVSSDLFSLPTAVPENGINNSVFLFSRLNQDMNQSNASQPRPNQTNLLMSWRAPWQWAGDRMTNEIDVAFHIQDKLRDDMEIKALELGLPSSFSAGINSALEPQTVFPGPMQIAIHNSLQPQPEVANELSFKGTFNTWRKPLAHQPPTGMFKAEVSQEYPELLLMGANYPNYLFS